MVRLQQIIDTLCSEESIVNVVGKPKKTSEKYTNGYFDISLVKCTEYSGTDRSLTSLCKCLNIDSVNELKTFIEQYDFNQYYNVNKIISLMSHNGYNNSTILFLSQYLSANIAIYFQECNITHLFYPEQKFNMNKKTIIVFLLHNAETKTYSFQTVHNDEPLASNDILLYLKNQTIFIPIGFIENKKFELHDPRTSDEEVVEFKFNKQVSQVNVDRQIFEDTEIYKMMEEMDKNFPLDSTIINEIYNFAVESK